MSEPAWRQWWRAATRPRLLGALAILLTGAVVCSLLGAWQWDRAQARGAQAAALEQAERESAPPVPLDSVVPPQTQLLQEMVGTRVTVRGEYLPDQFFVVGRHHEGQRGYWVLAGLRLTDGEHAGALVPVVRGWVGEADAVLWDRAPQGPVTVMAFLTPPEGGSSRLPEETQLDAISPAQLVNTWGGPIYSAYLRVITEDPGGAAGLVPVGAPAIEDAGLNLRNVVYALEWWVFGLFALFLWWRMVRDEVRFQRASRDAPPDAPPSAPPGAVSLTAPPASASR